MDGANEVVGAADSPPPKPGILTDSVAGPSAGTPGGVGLSSQSAAGEQLATVRGTSATLTCSPSSSTYLSQIQVPEIKSDTSSAHTLQDAIHHSGYQIANLPNLEELSSHTPILQSSAFLSTPSFYISAAAAKEMRHESMRESVRDDFGRCVDQGHPTPQDSAGSMTPPPQVRRKTPATGRSIQNSDPEFDAIMDQTQEGLVSSPLSPVDGYLLSSPVNGDPDVTMSSPPSPVSHRGGSKPQPIEHDRDEGSDGILRFKPTLPQWQDFSTVLTQAREAGAEKDGCFKVILPAEALDPIPTKPAEVVEANAFKPQLLRPSRIWRVNVIPTTGHFPSSSDLPETEVLDTADAAVKKLQRLFSKNDKRQLREVRYRVDVPAWTTEQRLAAGVPEKSPIHPLKGDKLDQTKAIIPGIHTPYVYESAPAFGATFQIHAEDYRLSSLNHLYKGRKIWIIVPSDAVDFAEQRLERNGKCSQFMRHRAEFVFPEKLKRLGIPYRLIDQRPGETIVILPDAYHEGFSTGYTLAEAKNYAEPGWTTDSYQPCDPSCKLDTAIPSDHMRLLKDGEERLDECNAYYEEVIGRKRNREEIESSESTETKDESSSEAPPPSKQRKSSHDP